MIESFTNADWARSPSKRKSTTGYCTFFVGGNLVTRESKKKNVVAQLSVKAKNKNNGTYCK